MKLQAVKLIYWDNSFSKAKPCLPLKGLRENAENIILRNNTMSDESPIIFTDSCCAKVADLIAEENNPDLKLRVLSTAAAVRVSSTDLLLTKSKTTTILKLRKTVWSFGRSDELSISGRCGNRLYGKSAGFAVRHPQSERGNNLRLRIVVFRVTGWFVLCRLNVRTAFLLLENILSG